MPRPRRVFISPPPFASSSSSKEPAGKFELEVIIYDKPKYIPYQGPPQPPISLVPIHDSDAFIVDKVVTPFDVVGEDDANNDGSLYKTGSRSARDRVPQRPMVKKVLNYVIGWPDIPYARQLVPCTQILDYVSPRTLEDWEYAVTVRQREEREAAAAAKTAKRKAKIKQEEVKVLGVVTPGDTGILSQQTAPGAADLLPFPARKKRGRPSRKQAEAAAAAAAVVESGINLDVLLPSSPPTKLGASQSEQLIVQNIPSLASGKQRTGFSLEQPFQQIADAPDAESSVEENYLRAGLPAATSRRAVAGIDLPTDDTGFIDGANDAGFEQVDIADRDQWEMGASDEEGYYDKEPTAVVEMTSTTSASESDRQGEADELESEEDDPTTQIAAESHRSAMRLRSLTKSNSDRTSTSLRSVSPATPQPQPPRGRTITPIPPPSIPTPKPSGPKVSPVLPPTVPGMPLSSINKKNQAISTMGTTETPILPPTPFRQPATNPLKRKRSEGLQPPTTISALRERAMTETNNAEDDGDGEEDDDLYEVERIEGDALAVDEENEDAGSSSKVPTTKRGAQAGRAVRYFLVRWKGDWPPDQNPTWEPAKNLPPGMVRQYLRRVAGQKASKAAPKAGSSAPGDQTRSKK